ncbi:S1/P1 nuclease [Endozoicomonadaceae bacterium StTr2]
MRAFSAGLVLSFSVNVYPWGETGHMLVMQIAMNIISQNHSDLLPPIENLRKAAQSFVQSLGMNAQQINSVIQASTFLDTYSHSKGKSGSREWHFINLPYTPDGLAGVNADSLQNAFSYSTNAALEIAVSINALCQERSAIWSGQGISSVAALAFLKEIHLEGDGMQPLHCMELFNSTFQTGDEGGNKFTIHVSTDQKELHQLWDDMGSVYPFISWEQVDCLSQIRELAKRLTEYNTAHPLPDNLASLKTVGSPWDSTFELFLVMQKTVYSGITPGGTIPSSYLETVQNYSRQLVYTAGQRLACRLVSILSKDSATQDHFPGMNREAANELNAKRIGSHLGTLMRDSEQSCCCGCCPVVVEKLRGAYRALRRLTHRHEEKFKYYHGDSH